MSEISTVAIVLILIWALITIGLIVISYLLASRLKKARETVGQARREYAELRMENKALINGQSDMEEKQSELQNELTTNESHAAFLQQQIARINAHHDSTEDRYRTAEGLIHSLETECRQRKEEARRFEEKLQQASTAESVRMARLKGDLAMARKSVTSLEAELKSATGRLDSANQHLKQSELRREKELSQEFAKRAEALEEKVKEGLAVQESLEKKAAASCRKVERLETELRRSVKRAMSLEAELALLLGDSAGATKETGVLDDEGKPIRQFNLQNQIKEDFVLQWARTRFKGVADRLKGTGESRPNGKGPTGESAA